MLSISHIKNCPELYTAAADNSAGLRPWYVVFKFFGTIGEQGEFEYVKA
jgi:hypothetical protein